MNRYLIILYVIFCCGCKTTSKKTQKTDAQTGEKTPHYIIISRTIESEQTNFKLNINSSLGEQLVILEECFSPIGINFNASWVISYSNELQFDIQGDTTPNMIYSMYRSYKQSKANDSTPFPHVVSRHKKDDDFCVLCGIPSPKVGQDRMIHYAQELIEAIREINNMHNEPQ